LWMWRETSIVLAARRRAESDEASPRNPAAMNIRVIISGRHYDQLGHVPGELSLEEGASVDEALGVIQAALPEGNRLPPSCLVAVSGQHLGTLASHQERTLTEGDELVVIAPVAGG